MRTELFFERPAAFVARHGFSRRAFRGLANTAQIRISRDPQQTQRFVDLLQEYAMALGDRCAIHHAQRIAGTRFRLIGNFETSKRLTQTDSACPYCRADALIRLAVLERVRRNLDASIDAAREAQRLYENNISSRSFFRVALCIAIQNEGMSLSFSGKRQAAVKLFRESLHLVEPFKFSDEIRDPHPSLPTEKLRRRIHRSAVGNLALGLTLAGTDEDLTEASRMLPEIKRQYPRRKSPLDYFRAIWLEARIDATQHDAPILRQRRLDKRRSVERKLSKVFTGLLEHGTPADAVCVLLDMATLPWVVNRPGKLPGIVAACFDQRDTKIRRQLANQLLAMEAENPELHSQVADLITAAERRDALKVGAGVRRLYDALHASGGSWPRFAAWDNTQGLRKTGPKGPRKQVTA